MGNAGMSGFVSFLDSPRPEPAAPSAPKAPDGDSYTVQVSGPVEETSSVQESKAVQDTGAVQPSKTASDSYTVQTFSKAELKRARMKRALAVEDGHSLAEQEIYRRLWQAGAPESAAPDADRTLRIGYDRLAAMVRLSWVTVKANLRSLERKLAIEVLAAEDSANRAGKLYRVYSAAAVQRRREEAGLVWVRRTRGVELLRDLKA